MEMGTFATFPSADRFCRCNDRSDFIFRDAAVGGESEVKAGVKTSADGLTIVRARGQHRGVRYVEAVILFLVEETRDS